MSGPRQALLEWLEFAVELGVDGLPVRVSRPAARPVARASVASTDAAAARPTDRPTESSPIARMRAALHGGPAKPDARPATRPARQKAVRRGSTPAAQPPPDIVLERLIGLPSGERDGPAGSGLFASAAEGEPKSVVIPASLSVVREDLGDCTRCKLHEGRTNIVFGVGNTEAELMFVGEGPGRDEDLQGEPFVGRAGKLLNDIIGAIEMRREDVYIANVVKCRPPENRNPEPDEVASCRGFLFQQLAVVRPKIVVALGRPAAETLLGRPVAISAVRGQLFDYHGAKLVPTYHPAFLLRSPTKKREVWEDMKLVRDLLRKG